MSNFEQLLRELRCDIRKDSEESLRIVEERITKSINENIDTKFEDIQAQIEIIKKNNNEQNERILAIEKQMKCRNIIFFGVEEGEKSYKELENKIINIVKTEIKVDCNSNEIEITRRMGKKAENKIRPIVATFTTYGKKISILKNKQHLKNKTIYLKEDYPKQILEKRKQLQDQLQQARKEGKFAYLRQDRLIIHEPNKTRKNAESTNSQSSRKRELESTPPSQMSNPYAQVNQPSTNYHMAKKNKHKRNIQNKGQSSMNSFLQKPPAPKIFTAVTLDEECDE
ncbi:uncharacterized protein LOC123870983 [Maniola jurtina]|uniref:uncharacterized protein LOC123870983 n=1 Tax=Maniola jurtina TaxID=191418 RepID=UPI001E6883C1|nr:uncharacterized protein LOC123870983 [Maniola jurtina]